MILTKEVIAEYALKTGNIYEQVCDSEGCGKLLRPGDLRIVLKWAKRTDGLHHLLGRIPSKVRCMDCERFLHPPAEVVKVKAAGRGAKAVSAKIAGSVQIDAKLCKIILRILKAAPEGIPAKELIPRLRKKKVVREASAKVLHATLKGMKKLKMFRRSKGLIMLPKEKKKKVSNKK